MTCKTWKRMIAVSLFAAVAMACVPAVGQHNPTRPTQDVVVVNAAGQPVPTAAQGTTNVAGTVNIGNAPNVNVANTPTVNLAAGGSINVTNPPNGQNNPTPLAVLEGTQAYEDSCSVYFAGQGIAQCNFQAIPSGKRLIIQEFDALGILEQGTKPAYIGVGSDSLPIAHYFAATFLSNFEAYDWFATHQETHLYVAPNVVPSCYLAVTATHGQYNCQFSGFLVDVP